MKNSTIKGITVEIGGDVSPLNKALSEVGKESRSIQNELSAINKLLKLDPENTELLAQKQNLLANSVSKAAEKLELLKKAQEEVNKKIASGEINKGSEEYREFQREIIAAEQSLKAAETAQRGYTLECEQAVSATARLKDEIQLQSDRLDELKSIYSDVVLEQGKNSDEARELKEEYDRLSESLRKSEQRLKDAGDMTEAAGEDAKNAGEDAEEAGKKAKKSGNDAEDGGSGWEKFGSMAKSAGKLAVEGIKTVTVGAAGAVAGVTTAFLATAEGTRETRTEMAKLETGFTSAGHSAEAGLQTYRELFAVLGDAGRATEASAHLALLASTEEDLQKWTEICTGVYATFGDSLPIEGLTEAANETAKTGSLTGVLADALNWAGVNEDDFQASLDGCSSEQERQALITETLTGLYQEQAETFRQVNADVIKANEAQESLTQSMAQIGAVAEPIMASIKTSAADILASVVPFVEVIGSGLQGALDGTAGAAETLAEGISGLVSGVLEAVTDMIPGVTTAVNAVIPAIVQGLVSALPVLVQTGLSLFQGVLSAITKNAKLLTDVLMQILTLAVQFIADNLPSFIDAGMQIIASLTEGIAEALPDIIQAIVDMIPDLVQAIADNLSLLVNAGITLIQAVAQGLINAIPQLLNALPTIISALLNGILSAVPQLINAGIQLLTSLVAALPTIIQTIVSVLPQIITGIIDALLANLPLIIQAGIDLLVALVQALPEIITTIVTAIPEIITGIVDALIGNIDQIILAGVQLFVALVENMPAILAGIVDAIPQIFFGIVDAFLGYVPKMAECGLNLIQGLWEGIKDAGAWLWDKISGFFDDIVDGIKDFFGIHSPSTVFRDMIGKNLVKGIAVGVDVETPNLRSDLEENMESVTAGLQGTLNLEGYRTQAEEPEQGGATLGGLTFSIQNFYNYTDKDMRQLTEEAMEIAEEYIRRRGGVFA